MTATAEPQTRRAPNRGSLRLDPAEGRRRIHLPSLAITVLLAGICALLAVWWLARADSSEQVVVLRNDVARGEVVTADDLGVASVSVDGAVNVIPEGSRDLFVGSVAISDLSAGTLPAPDQFRASTPLGDGEAIVGLHLGPGQVPTTRLGSGDHVDVLVVPDIQSAELTETATVASSVPVLAVSTDETSGRAIVSLVVPDNSAGAIVEAAATDRVWLVQVQQPNEDGG